MADKTLTGIKSRLRGNDIKRKRLEGNKLLQMFNPSLYHGKLKISMSDIIQEEVSTDDNQCKEEPHQSDEVKRDTDANEKCNCTIQTPIGHSDSTNSIGSLLFDHVASIRSGYNGIDVTMNDVVNDFDEDKIVDTFPKKEPISISIDIDLLEQLVRDITPSFTQESENNPSSTCKSCISPNQTENMKYMEMMTSMNIFESVTDMINTKQLSIASDDTELDSATDSCIHSPITPFTPRSDSNANNDPGKRQAWSPHPVVYLPAKSHACFYIPDSKQWCTSPSTEIKDDNEPVDEMDLTLIQKHLIQPGRKSNEFVYFDRCISTAANDNKAKVAMISSQGFSEGISEWIIQIVHCDVYLQEIGVVGRNGNHKFDIDINGIKDTNEFRARAVYGNELCTDSIYYGSWNSNGKQRCYRNLKDKHHIGWCSGDVIKVCLDLNSWKIKFWLNGVRVRKSISLQQGKTYYPVIGFSGNCVYKIVSLKLTIY